MTDSPVRPVSQRFELTALPPVRALAISAAAAVLAIVLLVVWGVTDLPLLVLVLGIVVLVLALSLALAALLLTRRLRTSVLLTTDAITIIRGRRTESLAWGDVAEVALRGSRLSLVSRSGTASASVINPRTPSDSTFRSLTTALQQGLNADRGYGGGPF